NICTNSIDEHGIYVSNSSDRPVVKNNQCFGNNGCGLHFNGDISMGGDGIIINAVIEGNILHDNGLGGGSAINMDGVQESIIINNLIYNNHATGIAMYMIDAAEGSKNNKVYNNTIINPSDARWGIIAVNGSTGNILYNNIIINHHNFRGSISIDESSTENFISDYNLITDRMSNDDGESNMSLEEWQSLGYDLHSALAPPENELFTNYITEDYTLIEGSEAVDKGTNYVSEIITKDLNNLSRPQGNGFDIGAYEYSTPSGIKSGKILSEFLLYQNYPNPFNPATKIRYSIGNTQFVTLKVFNFLGREVAALVNEIKPAGEYEIELNASELASGVYFYKVQAGDYTSTKKLILLK
ncbi:MAG: T9SS type A sorting domain-containing protein, partial [Ignavibacteria bacterium]